MLTTIAAQVPPPVADVVAATDMATLNGMGEFERDKAVIPGTVAEFTLTGMDSTGTVVPSVTLAAVVLKIWRKHVAAPVFMSTKPYILPGAVFTLTAVVTAAFRNGWGASAISGSASKPLITSAATMRFMDVYIYACVTLWAVLAAVFLVSLLLSSLD